jgi:hypothetical protein
VFDLREIGRRQLLSVSVSERAVLFAELLARARGRLKVTTMLA